MAKWLDNAVFYEIYPQSFNDTNGDGIGDFNGIIEKLDYIKKLGCNAIWINPCFESPFGDAGYDVSDYCKVAPRYGTNEDLRHLFDEVHKRDMHVLLDLVPGHTSVQHKWFKESMKAEKNEYTDRYVWTDSIWESPQNMGSIRGFSDRDGTCAVNFFSHQPALNYGFYKCERPWQQPMDAEGPKATLEAMKDVMRFWLGMGCDGFRVDMAGSLVKNELQWYQNGASLTNPFRAASIWTSCSTSARLIIMTFSAARNLSSPTEARAMFPSSCQSIRRITKSPRKKGLSAYPRAITTWTDWHALSRVIT